MEIANLEDAQKCKLSGSSRHPSAHLDCLAIAGNQ
jgi:hypothetical protein